MCWVAFSPAHFGQTVRNGGVKMDVLRVRETTDLFRPGQQIAASAVGGVAISSTTSAERQGERGLSAWLFMFFYFAVLFDSRAANAAIYKYELVSNPIVEGWAAGQPLRRSPAPWRGVFPLGWALLLSTRLRASVGLLILQSRLC